MTSINYIRKTVTKQTTPIFQSFIQIYGNFDNLEQLLNNLKYEFDIIALTEIWRTEGNQNFIPGLLTSYQNYEGISGSTLKGGCGFYIKNNISFVVRQELTKKHSSSQGEYETHWIEIIHTSKENLVVGVVYRYPKQKDTEFLLYLKQTLKALPKENKKVILTGNLNINLLNFDKNKDVNEFLDVITSNWFTPQILGPTRIVEHNKPSLADNIFVNFSDMHCTSGNIIEKITDH